MSFIVWILFRFSAVDFSFTAIHYGTQHKSEVTIWLQCNPEMLKENQEEDDRQNDGDDLLGWCWKWQHP